MVAAPPRVDNRTPVRYNKSMIASPGKAPNTGRRAEAQALLAIVPCGSGRGLAGVRIEGLSGSSSGEYFVPFAVGKDAIEHEYAYAGATAVLQRLRELHIDRVLIVVDDQELVDELERRVEPPRELFLHYVILGCKLNEFRRAKIVAAKSSRLEQLLTKTESLAATIYNAPVLGRAV